MKNSQHFSILNSFACLTLEKTSKGCKTLPEKRHRTAEMFLQSFECTSYGAASAIYTNRATSPHIPGKRSRILHIFSKPSNCEDVLACNKQKEILSKWQLQPTAWAWKATDCVSSVENPIRKRKTEKRQFFIIKDYFDVEDGGKHTSALPRRQLENDWIETSRILFTRAKKLHVARAKESHLALSSRELVSLR